jgi:hypothetical protein
MQVCKILGDWSTENKYTQSIEPIVLNIGILANPMSTLERWYSLFITLLDTWMPIRNGNHAYRPISPASDNFHVMGRGDGIKPDGRNAA